MKKILCAFIMIILSLTLCCCKTEKTVKEKVKGVPLSDGSETYYINEIDDSGMKIRSTRYNCKDKIIEEYEYYYLMDLNGKLSKITEKNMKTNSIKETYYNKFKVKTYEISYNTKSEIINKKEFLKNGNIKKSVNYTNEKETGYIVFDYYSDNKIKNETEYSETGIVVRNKTYYKDGTVYQIKEFDGNGMINKIIKYNYKNNKLIKISEYNGDFELISVKDYSKNNSNNDRE